MAAVKTGLVQKVVIAPVNSIELVTAAGVQVQVPDATVALPAGAGYINIEIPMYVNAAGVITAPTTPGDEAAIAAQGLTKSVGVFRIPLYKA